MAKVHIIHKGLLDDSVKDEFWSIRGRAIDAYAQVEHQLCQLMAVLLNSEVELVSIVFFKNTSADAQTKIIQDLLKAKYGEQYTTFWNSFGKLHGGLAIQRNNIVHWTSVVQATLDNKYSKTVLQKGTTIYKGGPPPEQIDTEKMIDFIKKCTYLGRACFAFTYWLQTGTAPDVPAGVRTWSETFQQQLTWPSQADHPLTRILQLPGIRHLPAVVQFPPGETHPTEPLDSPDS
jgi:hypothetical protein